MSVSGAAGPVLGKRSRCNRSVPSKRRKHGSEDPLYSNSEGSEGKSEFELNSDSEIGDIETRSSASTPPTPKSLAASQSAKSPHALLRYPCTYDGCDKAFSRPVRLEEHIRSHTNERPFKCSHGSCEKNFLRQSHLDFHIKSAHTGEKDYICDWEGCDKKFATGTRLRRHQKLHEKRDRFRCSGYPPCTKTFRKHGTLQRHIDVDHLQRKPYQCKRTNEDTGNNCNESFDTPRGLRSHEARYHEGNQYWCSICGSDDVDSSAGFATHAELLSHSKLKHPPECEHCGLVCSTAGELRRHVDIQHSGVTLDDRRTFVCPEPDCGKGFTKQGNLNIHIRSTHEKKKPFVCGETDVSQSAGLEQWDGTNACERGFTAKASLETHVRKFHLSASRPLQSTRSSSQTNKKRAKLADQSSYRKTPSLAAKLTGSGYIEESGRALACPVPSCKHRFKRHGDLRQHVRATHGLEDAETAEALAERIALSGGRFWLGGVGNELGEGASDGFAEEDEEDWREATGLDVPGVNVGAGGFVLPFAQSSYEAIDPALVSDEHNLAGAIASCLNDDNVAHT